ncbi:hypothetical protein V1264_008596 [Littorina saxatilis]|uniref:Receptor ligand binding region domain-containing protein n=1 Tax=Littorina saxatilis TaxID=31220 RepID=A0AAN9AUS1_9CAEN
MNATKEFKIALLGPWSRNSVKPVEKHYMEKAANYTIAKLNERCAIPGYRLTYSLHDTKCHPGVCIVEMAKARKSNARAFIGPACEFNCFSASKLSREWNMTMVSYACQSNLLSDRQRHPYFVRTVTTFLETGRFIGAVLDHFEWDKVCIVLNNALSYPWMELMDEIKRNYAGLQPTQWTTELSKPEKFSQELDAHMLKCFVFVLCMYTNEVIQFLANTKKRGYFETGRVYIAVDFLSYLNEDFTGLLDITLDANQDLEPFVNFFSEISCLDNDCITVEELHQRNITRTKVLKLCNDPVQLYSLCCEVDMDFFYIIHYIS